MRHTSYKAKIKIVINHKEHKDNHKGHKGAKNALLGIKRAHGDKTKQIKNKKQD